MLWNFIVEKTAHFQAERQKQSPWRCSVKKVLLKISQNSIAMKYAEAYAWDLQLY